ncbi:type II and III secretion system protein family protein [Rhodoferax ferrireducens]|uniref:type II and III secretion system protein family protein n=1 Tax=Rhodoferax ferrireducens TaxID=192843 RepID=UPI000E0D24E2|nr:type II and III secretion system protein family protein [Rhodoferax ferrireducens]
MSSPSRAIAITCMALAAAQAGEAAPAKAPAPVAASARPAAPSTTGLCSRVNIAPAIQIPVGKSTILRPSAPVTRILLGNPENARAARPAEKPDTKKDDGVTTPAINTRPGVAEVDVLLLAPTEVYLLGKTIGSTNVVMLDRDGTCTAFDVVVAMDTTALLTVIGQLMPAEKEIKVTSAFDSIVLSGVVSDGEALTRVTDLANAYVRGQESSGQSNQRVVNMLEVAAAQQVMLEVKVAEVSKALIDKLGVQFRGTQTNGNWTYSLLADFLTGGNAVATAIKSVGGNSLALDAQKDDSLVKILAEPTIMAISGQTGSFLAGGKIFIPVSQDSSTGGGRTITLEEKEFGVSVKFTPTVLGNGRINLRVRPEVSELNREGVGIVASGVTGTAVLPSFTSRKAETTVQLMDGQSFAIGGLIKNNTTTNIKAFPFLGELPVVGALFRSTEFQSDRSELVFVITPRLVKPLPVGYRLPTDGYVPPTRSELMLGGKLEGQRSEDSAGGDNPAQGGFDKEKK